MRLHRTLEEPAMQHSRREGQFDDGFNCSQILAHSKSPPILREEYYGRKTMKKSSLIVSIAGIATLILPLSLSAQDQEEEAAIPPLSDVWIIVPKRGMEAQFAEAVAADIALRAAGDDSREWIAYTVEIGHNRNLVQFRSCCFNWADQDAYEAEEDEKGFNANWNENVDRMSITTIATLNGLTGKTAIGRTRAPTGHTTA